MLNLENNFYFELMDFELNIVELYVAAKSNLNYEDLKKLFDEFKYNYDEKLVVLYLDDVKSNVDILSNSNKLIDYFFHNPENVIQVVSGYKFIKYRTFLMNDIDFVYKVAEINPHLAAVYSSSKIKENINFVIFILEKGGHFYLTSNFLSKEIKENKEVALTAIKTAPYIFKNLSNSLKMDNDIKKVYLNYK